MVGSTLTRGPRLHPAPGGSGSVAQAARERVLDRILRALAEGDEAGALRIAPALERRFAAAQG